VIDKCTAVIFFANVNTDKANSSQQMDCKVRSHDLGNLLRSYYYVKKVLQFVRLVTEIRVKEKVYSIFKNKVHIILMQRDAWYKTWHMRGVSYAILTLRNGCSVGYLLPNIETFNSTTTEKSIYLFTDVAIHEVAWYVIKQKKMTHRNSCTTQPKQIFMVLLFYKNIRPILGTLCAIIRRLPIF
jgi:hypothetical protein